MRRRLVGMAATLGALVFIVLTSSDVATLLSVVVHLPPNWVLSALFIVGTFLLVRWLLRRLLGTRLAPLIRLGPVERLYLDRLRPCRPGRP